MKKRILSIFTALTVILSVIVIAPITATAETYGVSGIFEYSVFDGEATITGCATKPTGDLKIPDTLDGYSVTNIGYEAFYYCTDITSVTMGDNVTGIGREAFYNCSGLTSIIIGKNVSAIGDWAFNQCSCLSSIVIPDSVTVIGDNAFGNCSGLKSVITGKNLKNIGSDAFSFCSELVNVTLGENLINIGDNAFRNCAKLESIDIPDSVKTIGDNAFEYCTQLKNVFNGNGLTTIGDYAFEYCSELKEITISDNVVSIGVRVFYECNNLATVNLGKNLKNIGNYAFYNCKKLTSIYIPDNVTTIGEWAFGYCSELTSVNIGKCVTNISDYAFGCCTNLKNVTIGNGVTNIGNNIFLECNNIEYNISDNVYYLGNDENPYYILIDISSNQIVSCTINSQTKIISNDAFSCSNLESIVFPNGVEKIGEYVLWNDNNLISVYIPKSVKSIGTTAFGACYGLTDINVETDNENYSSQDGVLYDKNKQTLLLCPSGKSGYFTLPDSVTNFLPGAFQYCNKITGITVGEDNKNYSSKDGVLFNKDKTTLIAFPKANSEDYSIPNSVTSIADYAFWDSSITGLTIPASVKKVGVSSFDYCRELTNVTLFSTQISFDNTPFWDCEKIKYNIYEDAEYLGNDDNPYVGLIKVPSNDITGLTINDKTGIIMDYAFSNCSELTDITIPESVVTIGNNAFFNCSVLSSITIPDGVTTIGRYAFSCCYELKNIEIGKNLKYIGNCAFESCYNLKTVNYCGTAEDREKIEISEDGNNSLTNAEWIYNYNPNHTHFGGTATCSSKAICTECKQEYGEFNPDIHTGETVITKRKDATCTADGYTGDTLCFHCGKKISTGTTVKATGHKGGTATCCTKAKCSVCKQEYGELNPNNHTGGTTVKNKKTATCSAKGYTGDTYCIGCNKKIKTGNATNMTAHKYANITDGKCSVCGKVRYNGLTKVNGIWYYYKNGVVDKSNTLVKYNGAWYHVNGGKWNSKEGATLVKYSGSWYYCVGGKMNTANTLVKYSDTWYHVNGGKWNSKEGATLVKYSGSWYYCVGGKMNTANTLVKYSGTWYHVNGGKWNSKEGATLVKYSGKWYYCKGGKVNFNYTGNVKYGGKTYKVVKGIKK